MKVDHRCHRCNHRLTRPDSIKQGLGPVCLFKQIYDLVIKRWEGDINEILDRKCQSVL